jgi:hypothetical protein
LHRALEIFTYGSLAGSERHLDHATNAVKLTAPIAGWRNTTRSGEASIRDSFTNGRPELDWLPYPNFNQDNLRGTIDETSPEGEAGVGVLDNKNVVGFAALSYAATISLSDFYLETWIHAQVTRAGNGPLNGIAFHIDTVSGNFYRVATQFMGAEPKGRFRRCQVADILLGFLFAHNIVQADQLLRRGCVLGGIGHDQFTLVLGLDEIL